MCNHKQTKISTIYYTSALLVQSFNKVVFVKSIKLYLQVKRNPQTFDGFELSDAESSTYS